MVTLHWVPCNAAISAREKERVKLCRVMEVQNKVEMKCNAR